MERQVAHARLDFLYTMNKEGSYEKEAGENRGNRVTTLPVETGGYYPKPHLRGVRSIWIG